MLVRVYRKPGRNDLCPCGSGKKFKNCTCKDKEVVNDILDKSTGFVYRDGEIVGEWDQEIS